MNRYTQSVLPFFSKPSGPAVDTLKQMRRWPEFRRARFYPRRQGKDLQRLVIGLGQIHPVAAGRFSYFLARKIGKVQAWLFEACHRLHTELGADSFGEEGYAEDTGGIHRTRLPDEILKQIKARVGDHAAVEKFLLATAQDWRRALKRGDDRALAETLLTLDALTLLQAVAPAVTVFPIEQRDVHGRIYAGITALQTEIHNIENTSAYRSCRKKGGKNLTKAEYEAATKRNALIKEYHRLLDHPERERSIWREVLEHATGPVTVFLLGSAHRRPFLRLVKRHLPEDVLFVWITPRGLR